jgi:hypothetical protein
VPIAESKPDEDERTDNREYKKTEITDSLITRLPTYLRVKQRMATGVEEKLITEVIDTKDEIMPSTGKTKHRCLVVYENGTTDWVPIEKVMVQMLIKGYEGWLRTEKINPRDLLEEHEIEEGWPISYIPMRVLLTLFIEHLEYKTLAEIIKSKENKEVDKMVRCTMVIKMVDEEWLDDAKMYNDEVRPNPGIFDEGYIAEFVKQQVNEGLLDRHHQIWKKKQEKEKQLYWENIRKAEVEDQPNKWIEIAMKLNMQTVKNQEEVLTLMGLTGGPCCKCFSLWHSTKNHKRRVCKRCGNAGHLSRECDGRRSTKTTQDGSCRDKPINLI